MKIFIKYGESKETVSEFIKKKAHSKQCNYWIEPVPCMLTVKSGFFPCLTDNTETLPERIYEARIFQEQGFTHIVEYRGGCRWCNVFETNTEGSIEQEVEKTTQEIYLRRDLARFGLVQTAIPYEKETASVVNYLQNGRVIFWRIVPEVKRGGR